MKKKTTYDRKAVGKRLQSRRKREGWSRKYVAEKIGLVEKYYADIERGTCGMSIETLIALTDLYGFTMDALIYGEKGELGIFGQDKTILQKMESLPPQLQNTCWQLVTLFVNGIPVGEQREQAADTTESAVI